MPAKGRVRLTPDGQTAPAQAAPEDPRERAIEAMVSWCRDGVRPVWLVEGLAGAGKTGLASDVADRLSASVSCGWARPGLGAYAVTAAARNGRPALLLVDDAETRADVLDLLVAVSERGQQARMRVILTARDFGRWWTDLLARLSSREREDLTAGRTVLTRASATTAAGTAPSPREVAPREVGVGLADPRAGAVTTLATADAGSAAVLLRQAAVVVALSTRVGQLGPAAVRCALRDLFEGEEGYWRRTSAEVTAPGQPQPALRSALTSAAVLGADGLAEAATALRRVPALAVGAADRLARLAVWWHGRYARLGESSVSVARLPSWLADRMPAGTDRTGLSWTVAALDAERRATSTLHRMAMDAHRDVWPVAASRSVDIATREAATAHDSLRRAVAAVGPVDEALAWLTQELDLSEADLDALSEAIGYPARSLSRTAVVLARRLLAMASDGWASDGGRLGRRRAAGRAHRGTRRPVLRDRPVGRGPPAHRAGRGRLSHPGRAGSAAVPARPGQCGVEPRFLPGSTRRARGGAAARL